jgi:hypothetical protein
VEAGTRIAMILGKRTVHMLLKVSSSVELRQRFGLKIDPSLRLSLTMKLERFSFSKTEAFERFHPGGSNEITNTAG